jgi:hypothetical protein
VFLNLDVTNFDLFVNIHCFELPLLVSTNRCKTTSMLLRFLSLSCCCANHFQLILLLSVTEADLFLAAYPIRFIHFQFIAFNCLVWMTSRSSLWNESALHSFIVFCTSKILTLILCMFLRLLYIFITAVAHILGTN